MKTYGHGIWLYVQRKTGLFFCVAKSLKIQGFHGFKSNGDIAMFQCFSIYGRKFETLTPHLVLRKKSFPLKGENIKKSGVKRM